MTDRQDGKVALLGRPPIDALALERLASEALTSGDFETAHRYIDRRCRIEPPALAHCFVLRAESAQRMGLKEAALADLEAALAIAPHDLAANRRLLAWGDLSQRRRAAADILSQDGDAGILARALAELRDSGQRAWAALTCYDGYVTGWVAWTGTCRITVSLSDSESSLVSAISSDAHHPLARGSIHAATIRMIRPRTPVPQRLVVACDDEPLQVRRLAPNLRAAELRPPGPRAAGHAPGPAPTVIVPVYADAPATRACLESLLAAKERCRLLVVNDASPDPEIRDYLAELASKGRIELLVNEINAGFVGAVNRGLRHAPSGDVILLNADTIVPPGFATRLAAAAHSAPDTRLQSSVRDEHLLHGTVLRGSGPAGRLVAANLRTLAENGNTMNEQDLDVLADGAIELAARAVAPVLQSVAKTGTTAPLDSLVTIRRYVDRHLMSPALTPNSIARTFGLSRASLYRLFEPVGGIAGYIREARLRRAYQQITTQQESGRRIGQIAYGLGFKNVGTFNRLFRKTYGFNPGEARRLSAVTPNAFLKTEDHEMSLAGCLRQIGGQ